MIFVSFQIVFQLGHEFIHIDGFGYMCIHTAIQTVLDIFGESVGSHGYDRDLGIGAV